MRGWHRELKAEGTNVEEIIWWKMDDDHHQTVIVYPSKEAAQYFLGSRFSVFLNNLR